MHSLPEFERADMFAHGCWTIYATDAAGSVVQRSRRRVHFHRTFSLRVDKGDGQKQSRIGRQAVIVNGNVDAGELIWW